MRCEENMKPIIIKILKLLVGFTVTFTIIAFLLSVFSVVQENMQDEPSGLILATIGFCFLIIIVVQTQVGPHISELMGLSEKSYFLSELKEVYDTLEATTKKQEQIIDVLKKLNKEV
jgi:hypothetical protein